MSLRGNALLDALRHEPADLHYFLVIWSNLILGDGKIKYRAYLNKRMQRIQENIPTQGRDGNELNKINFVDKPSRILPTAPRYQT